MTVPVRAALPDECHLHPRPVGEAKGPKDKVDLVLSGLRQGTLRNSPKDGVCCICDILRCGSCDRRIFLTADRDGRCSLITPTAI
jgi:hypothetical protein